MLAVIYKNTKDWKKKWASYSEYFTLQITPEGVRSR